MALYHKAEGGDIAAKRQPPPGYDLPYPNLASVPPAPEPVTSEQRLAVQQGLAQARAAPELPTSSPDPAANVPLGGLSLPASAPPRPDIPGIDWRGMPQPASSVRPTPPPAPAEPAFGQPVLLAFPKGSAILDPKGQRGLRDLALARGTARIRVGGFGEQKSGPDEAALKLALRRARRIADALTAAGVPPSAISLMAAAVGSGGFAQLVY